MTNEDKSLKIIDRLESFFAEPIQPIVALKIGIMEMAKWKDEQCCANCEYLNIYNGKTLYAMCEKWGWNFLPFQADTRTTRCGQFKEMKGGKNEK